MLPLVYGVIMFLGLLVMLIKYLRGSWLSLAVDISVFWLVFQLHGGSMAGGFSAMIAALLAGLVVPFFLRRK
jgi:hypothetical protein